MSRYCTKCGKEINEDAVVCIHCGCSPNETKHIKEQDSDSIGWGFLGFFVPLAGLILWLMWKDEAPKKAKSLGIGALVSTIIVVVGAIGYAIFIAVVWGLALSESGMMIEAVRRIVSPIALL